MRLIQWRCNPNPQTYRQIMVMESCNHMEVLLNVWENTNYVDLQSDLSFHIFSIEFSHAATFFGRLQHTKSRVGWCRHAPNDLVCRGWYSHSTARLTDLQYWSILRIWETLRDCGTISSLYIYTHIQSHTHIYIYIHICIQCNPAQWTFDLSSVQRVCLFDRDIRNHRLSSRQSSWCNLWWQKTRWSLVVWTFCVRFVWFCTFTFIDFPQYSTIFLCFTLFAYLSSDDIRTLGGSWIRSPGCFWLLWVRDSCWFTLVHVHAELPSDKSSITKWIATKGWWCPWRLQEAFR